MKKFKLSIIIPTYNRKEYLLKCLSKIQKQNLDESFEIIIVDDGSTDNTKNYIKKFIKKTNIPIKYFKQKNLGPATARNFGIKNARGEYILFMGDDTYPINKNFLQLHIELLEKYPNCASLGFILWHPKYRKNKFMQFLCPKGPQFNYGSVRKYDICPFEMFWTSNIALKKSWFDNNYFDENFPYAAYEDIELGYKLCLKGLKIVFNHDAIIYHDHYYNIELFLDRQYKAGKSLYYFISKWPNLKNRLMPKNMNVKKMINFIIKKISLLQKNELSSKYYFRIILDLNLLRGYYDAKSKDFDNYS